MTYRNFMIVLADVLVDGRKVAAQLLLHCGHVVVIPRKGPRFKPSARYGCPECAAGRDQGWRCLYFPPVDRRGKYAGTGQLPLWECRTGERFEGWAPPRLISGTTDEGTT